MADYHSPTVVQPDIPATDMTPLERPILDLVFDSENSEGGIYYHSWCGPSDVVTLSADDLRTAWRPIKRVTQNQSGVSRPLSACTLAGPHAGVRHKSRLADKASLSRTMDLLSHPLRLGLH